MNCDLNELTKRWKNILDTLIRNYHFGDFLVLRNADSFYEWDKVYGSGCKEKMNLSFHHGVTRLVINDELHDCVIKIQFLPHEWEKYIYDYNETESVVFDKAVKEGLAEHFAWMYKMMDYNFIQDGKSYMCPIYAMEFCEVDFTHNEKLSEDYQFELYCDNNKIFGEEKEEERNSFNCDSGEEDNMLELASYLWKDSDDFCNFESFLNDLEISDLHSGNWGFVDDRFVLCDYGGYHTKVAGIEPVTNPNYLISF